MWYLTEERDMNYPKWETRLTMQLEELCDGVVTRGNQLTVLKDEDVTWPTLTNYFIDFLRGHGYVFQTSDYWEYMKDKSAELADAEEEEDDECDPTSKQQSLFDKE